MFTDFLFLAESDPALKMPNYIESCALGELVAKAKHELSMCWITIGYLQSSEAKLRTTD